MAGSDKILRVTYGAFSCGLDGFDDPLQTMTAILDYLRYLEAIAGDGGAAAGAPDIDILTSIAARGTTRRVEVEMQTGEILLRAVPARNCATGSCPEDDTIPASHEGCQRMRPVAPPAQARVLPFRRATLEQLIDRCVLPHAAGPSADALRRKIAAKTRSAGAESDLQRALAGIDTERADAATPAETDMARPADTVPDTTCDAGSPDSATANRRPRAQHHAINDLSRIFEETDNQLDTPASIRRRNAIRHLRAALAATRAEIRTSSPPRRDRDETPGRAGLRAAARLRGGRRAASQRGAAVHLADPLPLMAEQRIHTRQGSARPRPLASMDRAATPPEPCPKDFGTFVARVEAARLPDLIEAAAAYLADIEGRVRFSRPMLMEKLDQIGVTDMREDMLRACDALLTEGKLRKCSDGRYATTDKTGFRVLSDAGPT